ncbi:unnamed protein product [Schistosoma turkestanicum]|nr:unnamed protein product [Schistosoma turkestanicum]
MQAIAASPSLVHLLERSAQIRPDKFIYRLLCLLKGLQCSSQYIAENNLGDILRENHEALINDIVNTQNWAIHEQQDAHELFGFIMERAYSSQDNEFFSKTCARKISNLFNINLPDYERIVICQSYCSAMESIKCRTILCDTFPTHMFEQILMASQVTCNYCNYHSKVVIQPESCLTIFLKNPNLINIHMMKGLQQSHVKTSKKVIDLIECLNAQSAIIEYMPDMKCPKCHQSTMSTSKSSSSNNHRQREQWIMHTPKYLVLYIQRSDWLNIGGGGGVGAGGGSSCSSMELNHIRQFNRPDLIASTTQIAMKRSEHVHIPEYLNMAPYLLLSCRVSNNQPTLSETVNPYGDNENCECSPSDKLKLFEKNYQKPYILRSVIVHEGAFLQCGHYITYRKWRTPKRHIQQSKKHCLIRILSSLHQYISNYFQGISITSESAYTSSWILTSDAHVIRVPFKQIESSPAYLLFYERSNRCDDQRSTINATNSLVEHNNSSCTEEDHSVECYNDSDLDNVDDDGVMIRNLSKADIIKSYAMHASTFEMYSSGNNNNNNKSLDVSYS